MQQIQSKITTKSQDYKDNYENSKQLLTQLKERIELVKQGGPESARKRHLDRGKLLTRDRVENLLDPETPFIELSQLAAWDMYENQAPAAGIITGIGVVKGREVMIVANDATVKGGTYFPMTIKKHIRAQEIAIQNHLPCIYLVDSGGIFCLIKRKLFPIKIILGRFL